MLTGKHAGEFHLPDSSVEVGEKIPDFGKSFFVIPLLTELNQNQKVIKFLLGRLPVLNEFLQPGSFFQSFLSLVSLVPEFRPGNFRLQFRYALALLVDVKGTSSARRAFLSEIQDVIFHHETFSTLQGKIEWGL